jgi:signal transduction histidine kinase
MLPLIGGLLFSIQGIAVGTIFTILFYFFFLLTEPFWGIEKFPPILENYQNEKAIDVSLFCITMFYFTYHFISSQENAQREINIQKNRFEGLLGILIHDVANPLQTIKMKISVAQTNPQKTEKFLKDIEKQTDHLCRLIGEVRTMKAINDNKVTIKTEKINVENLLKDAIELYSDRAIQKQIKIVLTVHPSLTSMISVDPVIFKSSIIGNLISNAIKFSPEGKKIEITVYNSSSQIIIEVKDQGIGIPKTLIAKLFDPKANTTRIGTSGEKGTGFGLLIVQQWTQSMNGKLEIQSETAESQGQNTGTSFRLSFPRAS